MKLSKEAANAIESAAESLLSAWCAEDAGEHEDSSMGWYRYFIGLAVNEGCAIKDARRMAADMAREMYAR